MLRDTLLKEIMVTKIVTMQVDQPFSAVEEKLRLHRIRHLPVVDSKNKLVGIITQTDLFRSASPRHTEEGFFYDKDQLDTFVLKTLMTPNPLALRPENTVADAVDVMITRKYGCIPIVEGDRTLAGIVTQIDILKFVAKWFHPH